MAKDKKEKEELVEEILEEVPKAEIINERELPAETGEETSDIVEMGGRMMRAIKTSTGTKYKPL